MGGIFVTTTKEGNAFACACTRPTREFYKKETTYVVKIKNEELLKRVLIREGDDMDRKIKKVGNLSNTNHGGGNVYSTDGLSPTLLARDYKDPKRIVVEECIGPTQKHAARTDGKEAPTLTEARGKGGEHIPMLKLRETTSKGYAEATTGDGVLLSRKNCTLRRGVTQKDATGTLLTEPSSWGTITPDFRIRKLTPLECERLQAFPDNFTKYGKDGEEISNTQRYKCVGNAVTTTVITYLADEMFKHLEEEKEE